MKRVLCINAKPIEGHGNTDLHLLQEGKDYPVIGVNEDGHYNIGVRPLYCVENNVNCYWGKDRFIECQEDDVEGRINIKGKIDGKDKRSNTEGDKGSDTE